MAAKFNIRECKAVLLIISTCVIHVTGQNCTHHCLASRKCLLKEASNECYYLFPKVFGSWQENNDFCKSQKLTMAQPSRETVHDGFDLNDLFTLLDYYRSESGVWLGGKSKNLDKWRFVEGEGGDKFLGKINNDDLDGNFTKCGFVYADTMEFGVQDCMNENFGVCRYETCKNDEDCLRYLGRKENWFEARALCVSRGGELVYLSSDEQLVLEALNKTLRSYLQSKARVHVGFSRRLWIWNDGLHIKYSNWMDNRPNMVEESCLMMNGLNSKWQDEKCTDTKMTLCQNGSVSTVVEEEKIEFVQIAIDVIGAILGVSLFINAAFAFTLLCCHWKQKNAAQKKVSSLDQVKKLSISFNESNDYTESPGHDIERLEQSKSSTKIMEKSEIDSGTTKSNKKPPKRKEKVPSKAETKTKPLTKPTKPPKSEAQDNSKNLKTLEVANSPLHPKPPTDLSDQTKMPRKPHANPDPSPLPVAEYYSYTTASKAEVSESYLSPVKSVKTKAVPPPVRIAPAPPPPLPTSPPPSIPPPYLEVSGKSAIPETYTEPTKSYTNLHTYNNQQKKDDDVFYEGIYEPLAASRF